MGLKTTGGMIIAIGPAPATVDLAGFQAVAVEDIGEVTDIGAIGKIWNSASHNPLATSQVIEKKTSYNLQHPELTLALDEENQGQIDADVANDGFTDHTIKITRQNGDAIFFVAEVSGFTSSFASDSFENGSISLLAQTQPLKDPVAP